MPSVNSVPVKYRQTCKTGKVKGKKNNAKNNNSSQTKAKEDRGVISRTYTEDA